ncbi:helix-turn-helix domain-containing protein [Vibrio parahaemolyticus]|uniref:helix-turn-helix domain-containing protein n=1 Tax=Vibrio parahaemolyticus TaxID=670 RepID=UPI00081BCE17|nr:helix-turn-helix domain-containing protein [Vibrio parahaemolyticus]
MSNLLSINEVCNLYKVTRKTIYNWQSAGKITIIKKGRKSFVESTIIDDLAERRATHSVTQNDTDLHSVITQLSDRITHLEGVITQLRDDLLQCNTSKAEKVKAVTQQITQSEPSESSVRPYDTRRAQEWLEKCQRVFTQLDPEIQNTITKKDFAALAGVSRGTVTKRWDEIISIADK